jgi:6-phosphogluconolactonase (cycloisomerase 2 family)
MKLSLVGRYVLALFASLALGLGMTGCGGGSIAYLWAIGQQYNQISGFKVDDYTGNLTQIPHQPYDSGGAVPISIVVKPGYRYVYVLNQGTNPVPPTGAVDSNGQPTTGTHATGGSISVFSVGGDGSLTFQQNYTSQGFNGQYLAFDTTGNYLYVLDQYAPDYNENVGGVVDKNGSLTAYAVDSSTGRLTVVQNTQSVSNGQPAPTYFEVGALGQSSQQNPNPFMMKEAGNCLFVATRTAIVPFSFGGNGQLVTATTGAIQTGNSHISSIGGNGSFVTVTDDVDNTLSVYTVGSSCALNLTSDGKIPLQTRYGVADPVYSFIDASNTYVYVLDNLNTGNPSLPASTVMAFKIQSNNTLQPLVGSPYGVGSGPVCMAEDPTNQYLYVANHNDGTITGFVLGSSDGQLSPLTRGSTFQATGQLNCLVISAGVD